MVPATARYLIICMFFFKFWFRKYGNGNVMHFFFAQVATAREDMEVAMVVAMVVVTGAVTAATVVARAATAARAATEVVDRAAMEQPRAATVGRPAVTAVLRVDTELSRVVTELPKAAASVQVIFSTVFKSILRNRVVCSVLVLISTFDKLPVRFRLRI